MTAEGPKLDLKPILTDGPPNFWIEICSDDGEHGIIVSRHRRFDPALAAYDALVSRKPAMRVVMRHVSHIYRNYILVVVPDAPASGDVPRAKSAAASSLSVVAPAL